MLLILFQIIAIFYTSSLPANDLYYKGTYELCLITVVTVELRNFALPTSGSRSWCKTAVTKGSTTRKYVCVFIYLYKYLN